MTNDLGRYWDQPELDSFVVDDVRAYMRSETFDQLRDYSGTFPSGVYPGKMWKRRIDYYDPSQGWLLCWYADHPTDPEKCVVDHRRIFIEPEARQ